MEYAARFNELSRFTLHQVNSEERKMDHFEQGLRGDIKSVITWHTFANFQEMYQRAVKIIRVVEENERESQALNLEKRRREINRQGWQGRNDNRPKLNYPLEKGKQPMFGPPKNSVCQNCGRNHTGRCFFAPGNDHCYECGEWGHKKYQCPKLMRGQDRTQVPTEQPGPLTAPVRPTAVAPQGRPPASGATQQARNNRKSQAGGRVYYLEAEEGRDEGPHTVVSGTFLVNVVPVIVLFDAGATHSFISPVTGARMTCDFEELDVCLCVTTPIGSMYHSKLIAKDCAIIIQGRLFRGDLILLGIRGYDVIMGIDWLTKYCATIDCNRKTITLVTPNREGIQYKGGDSKPTVPVISTTKACKLIGKGCTADVCTVEASHTQELDFKDIPIVQEFPEVFQEVPGLPPDCEIEFAIELLLGTTPISKTPYRMAPTELVELKTQL